MKKSKNSIQGYMYILECADKTYYKGSTKDLRRRIWEHENFLGANYTKKKYPVKLVYYEEYSRISEAFNREKQVQGWSHAKKKALIENRKRDLPLLSRNYTQYGKSIVSTSSTTKDSVTDLVELTMDKSEWQACNFLTPRHCNPTTA